MVKRVLAIAMAFVGVVVGAGFASGQETMQYFVAFGTWGLAGVFLASLAMVVAGVSLLQFGSYYQAREHMAVLSSLTNKGLAWFLDIATVVTLFSIGFVMFAGGGANLNQAFGLDLWIGSLLMLILVLVTGMFDVTKVTAIIGSITPFIIIFILLTSLWTIVTADIDLQQMHLASQDVNTTLPNWWIAALNYTGMNVMTAVSMAIVIGGAFLDTKAAGWGGLIGGLAYLVMLLLLYAGLFIEVETVTGDDMPMLTLITGIHPVLGVLMAVVVYGMIFSTAISMFYALGKRLARGNQARYRIFFITACVFGFILSFVGFQTLIAYVYPVLGYIGIFMTFFLGVAWLRGRSKMDTESRLRLRAYDLTRRKLDNRLRYTKRDQRELRNLTETSVLGSEDFMAQIEDEVYTELEKDPTYHFNRDDSGDSVVYVSHSEPVRQNHRTRPKTGLRGADAGKNDDRPVD